MTYAKGDAYDDRWRKLAAAGESVHGEADLVTSLTPPGGSVLDAGCGTGRVAIELASRGFTVVGVDRDPSMLDTAREKAPSFDWHLADLASVALDAPFHTVVMAGNVLLFVDPGTGPSVVRHLAALVAPGGCLIAGFQLGRGVVLDDYDGWCRAAGLALTDRWATWDQRVFDPAVADYAVSVHRGS